MATNTFISIFILSRQNGIAFDMNLYLLPFHKASNAKSRSNLSQIQACICAFASNRTSSAGIRLNTIPLIILLCKHGEKYPDIFVANIQLKWKTFYSTSFSLKCSENYTFLKCLLACFDFQFLNCDKSMAFYLVFI